MRTVEVVSYDPSWPKAFTEESLQISSVLGENIVATHHIGSTAIPDIYAKPVIDLLVEVKDLAKVDEQNLQMASLGYEAMGEFGISGRRYFRKESAERVRTHHAHIFAVGSAQIERHLTFRDYMIAHPKDAQQYSQLKRQLASQYPADIERYIEGKDEFIQEIDRKAAQGRWSGVQPENANGTGQSTATEN